MINLDSSKLKEFADNNLKFDEYGSNFPKRIENTVGKGEIAHYEQFFLFPQCFQKTCSTDTYKQGLVWERVNVLIKQKHIITRCVCETPMPLKRQIFEKCNLYI